jgi:thioredoxin 1
VTKHSLRFAILLAVAVPAVSILQLSPPSVAGQSKRTSRDSSSPFAPLDQWKDAVLSGNKAALESLYSTDPAAMSDIPQGKTENPGEEPSFWAQFKTAGVISLNPKVLEMDQPHAGITELVLRIEGTLKTSTGDQDFVVGASQIWSLQGNTWRIVYTHRSDPGENAGRRLPEPVRPNTHLYPDATKAPAEIRVALAAAERDHKRVILVFGGNWCYDCHVLDTTFHSKAIAPLLTANYHVVHINIGNYDQNLDLADKYGVVLKKGVPALAILDSSGKLLWSQKNGDFENTSRIGPDDVTQFLNKWKPPRGA